MPAKALTAILCAAVSAASLPAFADGLSSCAAIDDSSARLACYDKMAGRRLPPGTGKWQLDHRRSAITGSDAIYLTLNADNVNSEAVPPWNVAQLVLRCDDGKTDAMVSPRRRLGTASLGVTVVLRVDGGQQVQEIWQISDDALFAYEPQPVPWIKSLFGAARLDVSLRPDLDQPIDYSFNVEGLAAASQPLARACSW